MNPPTPAFILKNTGKSITDLFLWNFCPFSDDCQSVCQSIHLLAGYSENGGVDIWTLSDRRVKASIPSPSNVISVYGCLSGEIIVLNKDGDLRVFTINQNKLSCNIRLNFSNIGFCKPAHLSTHSELVLALPGESTSSINVWDLNSIKLDWSLVLNCEHKLGMVMCLKIFYFDIHEVLLLAGYEDGSVALWNVKQERLLHLIKLYEEPVMCIDFEESTKSGIVGSPTEVLIKFSMCEDYEKKLELCVVNRVTLLNPGVADVKIRPDLKIVAVGGWDKNLRIFSWKTMKQLAVLNYHTGTVQSLCFLRHKKSIEQILASGSADHKIAVWRIYNDLV